MLCYACAIIYESPDRKMMSHTKINEGLFTKGLVTRRGWGRGEWKGQHSNLGSLALGLYHPYTPKEGRKWLPNCVI